MPETRRKLLVIGLTGSIGMGKTQTAKLFARLGVPVYDADAAVHALYARGGAAVPAIAEAFPKAVRDGAVDRAILAGLVTGDPTALQRLEQIVHPLVAEARRRFLQQAAEQGAELVVVDIPLLFETGGAENADAVVVVSAPAAVQRARVLARPGMTAEKFESLLAHQWPDAEKRAQADFVVETDKGLDQAFETVKAIVETLHARVSSEREH